MIFEARTTVHNVPTSTAEVANRLSRFNELYEALATKPDTAALLYRDAVTQSPAWTAVGNRLLVGRSPDRIASATGSVLTIEDQEMSRQHFEIVLTKDGLDLLKDLKSLNGTYVDGVRQEAAVLIGGSEIKAGKTTFIFTGV
jgi:pSer/pThr/pTyr-binding forkhead associated (FHA) protein